MSEIDRLCDELQDAEDEIAALQRERDEVQALVAGLENELEALDRLERLAEQAIEEAFRSALDVERGIYSLGEHIAQLADLRHGRWADRPVRS